VRFNACILKKLLGSPCCVYFMSFFPESPALLRSSTFERAGPVESRILFGVPGNQQRTLPSELLVKTLSIQPTSPVDDISTPRMGSALASREKLTVALLRLHSQVQKAIYQVFFTGIPSITFVAISIRFVFKDFGNKRHTTACPEVAFNHFNIIVPGKELNIEGTGYISSLAICLDIRFILLTVSKYIF